MIIAIVIVMVIRIGIVIDHGDAVCSGSYIIKVLGLGLRGQQPGFRGSSTEFLGVQYPSKG